MSTLVLLVAAAVAGALAGGALTGIAIRSRSRAARAPQPSDDAPQPLPSDVLAVLTAIPGIAIVVDEDNAILRADADAYSRGLVRGDELAHPAMVELANEVRRTGLTRTVDVQLPRSRISESGSLDLAARVAALPAGKILLLVTDRTQERRVEETRRDFTANVSHELKTPVGAIKLLAETLATSPDDPAAVRAFAPRLQEEADRLSALVQDIIELSRLQAPGALGEPKLVDVDRIVVDSLRELRTTAEAAKVPLVGPVAPSGAHVWGNGDMLKTAIRNLLENAVHYSNPNSSVSVGVKVGDGLVRIGVVDRGIGIAPEHQRHIFERFYRVDPARSRATGGTGLGLSIVKHVAQDHGGTVTVWSRPGRGSTFTLILPLAEGQDRQEEDEPHEGAATR